MIDAKNKSVLMGWRPLPRGKEVKIQGVSVRATRKPASTNRLPVVLLLRPAERRSPGRPLQEPPRSTRRLQSSDSHALPSVGVPS